MKHKVLTLALIGVLNSGSAADNFLDSLSEGESSLSFRYRYEIVDQDGFAKNANASTLRTRLNYKTSEYNGFSFFIEADNILEAFVDNYDAGAGNSPGNSQYPVVADPQGTEINQAWINYSFPERGQVKLGRQRILLDNQRFVGGVGWRQNEQTYDGISSTIPIAQSNLFLAYINNINRIFGDDVAAGDNDTDTILMNWSNDFQDIGKLTAYYYDIDNKDIPSFSTSTYGVKFQGKLDDFSYGIELSEQSDAHNNPVDYSASYWRLDGSYKFEKIDLFGGYEVLEGDKNNAGAMFRTPLATLHAFNGWADKFLNTPADGLEDTFIGLKGNTHGFAWQAVYHDFQAQDSNLNYGDEIDFSIGRKLNKNVSLLVKAAFFDAKDFATDTEKLWFMLSADF